MGPACLTFAMFRSIQDISRVGSLTVNKVGHLHTHTHDNKL